MTRRRAACRGRDAKSARWPTMRTSPTFSSPRARAAAARSDPSFADGAPPGRAERLALHLQRHLHLYRGQEQGRDRRSGAPTTIRISRRCSPRSMASGSRPFSSPIPIAITASAQGSFARRRARGWSAPRRSRPAATARPASIPPTTATIRLTQFSPTASGGRAHGYTIEAIATPGHCSNHLCFALLEENALFSGDHVMAWSTSIVAPPDGSMRAYMDSLDKLRGRARDDLLARSWRPRRRTATVLARADPSPAPAGSLDPECAWRMARKQFRRSSPGSMSA